MNRSSLWLAGVGVSVLLSLLIILINRPDRQLGVVPQPSRPKIRSELPVARDKLGYSLLPLVGNKLVQSELALSESQHSEIAQITADYVNVLAPQVSLLRQASGDRPREQAALAAFQARQFALLSEAGGRAAKVLTPAQDQRLAQILVQLRSIEIFDIPEFAAALGLSDPQRLEIRNVRKELETEAERLAKAKQARQLSPQDYDRHLDAAFQRAEQRVLPILNKDQQQQLIDWRGATIPFTRQSLRLVIHGRAETGR